MTKDLLYYIINTDNTVMRIQNVKLPLPLPKTEKMVFLLIKYLLYKIGEVSNENKRNKKEI